MKKTIPASDFAGQDGDTVRNFIARLMTAQRDDIPALTSMARALGNPAMRIVVTAIETGTDEQANIAATIAVGANMLQWTPVQNAFYSILAHRGDTLLHELVLPQIIDLAKNGASAAGKALERYVYKDVQRQSRYNTLLRMMGINATRYRHLPVVKVVGYIGETA